MAITNTSKTYGYQPALGQFVLTAFGRIGIRPTEITQTHMMNAREAANLVLSEWSSIQPNLWSVGLQTVPLIEGTATYSVPAEIVMVLDCYLSYGTPTTDRYLNPISRTDYATYPDKTTQGPPNVYWFDRLVSPTVTLWPVPDSGGPYVLKYYSVRQNQDAVLASGLTVEIPYRFFDAFVAALAWRLAEIYAPAIEARMQAKMERAWEIAARQDQENVPLFLTPGLSSYYRN